VQPETDSLAFDLDEVANATNYNAWVLSRARPYLTGRVLDFGAGIGTFAQELVAVSSDVVALEPDPLLHAQLVERVPGVKAVADPEQVEGPFDAIIAFNVIEHIADDGAVLTRLRELLAPEGKLLLLVPAHPRLFGQLDRAFEHYRRYTVPGLRALLDVNGLRPLEVRYVNPVGGVGWFVASRTTRSSSIPKQQLRLFDRAVPVLRTVDRVRLPFGLSVWAVAERR
jgi:SAM-dependent methyltransferase